MGADDWEDMSDGDGGDWESGKAIAPLSSARLPSRLRKALIA